jgi:hypothetical protein
MFLALLLLLPSCGDEGGLESSSTACNDKRDNDGDGKIDCEDNECQEYPFCQRGLSNNSCGDGVVSEGETCDTAIASGVGACPTDCDDGNACTFETLENANTCFAACQASPITQCIDGDGCCPEGCTGGTDNDCSLTCGNGALEPGEGCDTQIPVGQPGACPTSCDDGIACTKDTLLSGGTCDASCSYEFISTCSKTSDGCCPKGCDAGTDADCSPTCGNGLLEVNETCDTKIPAGKPGACPTACDDGVACTKDTLLNGGTCSAVCSASQITQCKDGDGCCPAGCTASNDNDCSSSCGNGLLEVNETCDTKIPAGKPGACPADCDDGSACTLDQLLNGGTCGAVCSYMTVTACSAAKKDGCCPAGCDATNDSDCSPTCGNGVLEPNETCDTKIPAGQPGACLVACDDGAACTIDQLLGAGTCGALCSHKTITACSGKTGDGCCPAGCNATNDDDCSPTCGNGVLEANEKCDTKIPAGQSGACPVSCDDAVACTMDSLLNAGTCDAVCSYTPVTGCSGKTSDACCPSGCNAVTDVDCSASCGNGVLEPGEKCDTKIPAGQAGACPAGCDDGKPCTFDQLLNGGTCDAVCAHKPVTACSVLASDGCCPGGCDATTDADCKPVCGNGVLEPGEACDTKIPSGTGACPTACPSKPCYTATLGNQGTCQAKCTYSSITNCSGKTSDGCCPANCNAVTDADCKPVCGNGVLEPGETCDTKIASGTGACPTACLSKPCYTATLDNQGTCQAKCTYSSITGCSGKTSDGCCPANCNANTDSDCKAVCGNGLVEPGETCDLKISSGTGACPTACVSKPCYTATLDNQGTCQAKCTYSSITGCSQNSDGCCPANCNANTDADCKPVCGNNVVEPGETCDIKIPTGQTGACPIACFSKKCYTTTIENQGTCQAKCTSEPFPCSGKTSDGCCSATCNANTDVDCKPVCGNGVLEPGEACDLKIPAGQKGACPTTCPVKKCYTAKLVDPKTCAAKCTYSAITTCSFAMSDGCCPANCTSATDGDCLALCGNGVLDSGETCDIKIPAGSLGSCPTSCDDKNSCTKDTLTNPQTCQAKCLHTYICGIKPLP